MLREGGGGFDTVVVVVAAMPGVVVGDVVAVAVVSTLERGPSVVGVDAWTVDVVVGVLFEAVVVVALRPDEVVVDEVALGLEPGVEPFVPVNSLSMAVFDKRVASPGATPLATRATAAKASVTATTTPIAHTPARINPRRTRRFSSNPGPRLLKGTARPAQASPGSLGTRAVRRTLARW